MAAGPGVLVEGAGTFPYAELYGHIPLAQRRLEPSLEARVAQLKGKKKARRNKTEQFILWMKEKAAAEEAAALAALNASKAAGDA
mgnify:CR=1 FL=1